MKKQILTNIRQNQFIDLVKFIPIVGISSLPFFFLLKINDWNVFAVVITLIFGTITFLLLYKLLKIAFLIINPTKSDLFIRYGGIDRLENIIKEIDLTIEYEVNSIVVSKRFILDREDYRKLTCLSDILNIHKVEHRTNGFTDFYYLVMTDKLGFDFQYKFYRNEWMALNFLYMHLQNNCDASFGVSKEAQNHIKNNTIKVDRKKNKVKKIDYYCPDCKQPVDYGDGYCKKCGCKIKWSIN